MKIFSNYVLSPQTEAIIPQLDEQGELHSLVIEGEMMFIVKMRPSELMDWGLRHYGSDLKGASSSSKKILGETKMVPVIVCGTLDIYWYPCQSHIKEENIWFALSHIDHSKQIEKNKTDVYLSSGNPVTVYSTKYQFEKRFDRASRLRYIYTKRTSFHDRIIPNK